MEQVKNTSNWSNIARNDEVSIIYLLKEDGFYLLQENGDRLIAQRSPDFVNQNKNISTWSNINKS